VCSAALFQNGQLLSIEELDAGFTHAENLHVFIDQVLKTAKVKPSDLTAIAVSKGPGSYTGLRIGVSAAKGLAYGLTIPLIGIDTLQIMCAAAKAADARQTIFAPMIDARRMEVYTALYAADLKPLSPVHALILDEESILHFKEYSSISFFGDGMEKAKTLLSSMENVRLIDGIRPSARWMGSLAYEKFQAQQFEDIAYFEPYYLKEFQAGKKKASL
jgi:tRNA threonylcarbamoyladenosine biosynthesis protein TsaB